MANEESISIRTEITFTDLNGITSEPVLTSPFTLLTKTARKVFTVTDTSEQTLWDPSNASEACSAFDVAIFHSTKTAELEVLTTTGATESIFVFTVAANTPFIISDDASYSGLLAQENGFTDGVDGVIDNIRAKNVGGSGDARMVLILGQT